MSVYLEAVQATREERENAESAFRAALREAAEHHSLSEIAAVAELTKSGVHYLIREGKP